MNWRIIGTLVQKDIALFLRNRFIAFLSFVSLIAYV
jgi:hypothetical protein